MSGITFLSCTPVNFDGKSFVDTATSENETQVAAVVRKQTGMPNRWAANRLNAPVTKIPLL